MLRGKRKIMIRCFDTHEVRKTAELNGLWEVEILEGTGSVTEEAHFTMMVPGCVESLPGLGNFRGKCRFSKEVRLEKNGPVKLIFYGVSFLTEVYWDGEKMADHYNAYTEFDVVLPEQSAGVHTLELVVDNSWNEDISALHIPNDYQSYNGITRPVELAYIPALYIDYVHMTSIWNREKEVWCAEAVVKLKGLEGWKERYGAEEIYLSVELCGQQGKYPVDPEGCADNCDPSSMICHFTMEVPEAESWEILHSRLYLLKTRLMAGNETLDDRIERVGFRRVEVKGREILLNGKRVFPQGFCRHEDHPEYGCSLPVEEMARDIALLLDMGCNSVRTTHYPNDQRFLDLCDEYGILVWEENHARGLNEEQMSHVNFDTQCAACNEAMVTRHYNHPSIYVWGILNECASETEYGYRCYEKQFRQIKELDGSRPVTFSSCRNFKDISFGLVDIVSMNVYPGWYHDTPPGKWVDDLEEWIETTDGAGKPLILSEFGAGAIYGFHDYDRVKWSEERQADILKLQLQAFLRREYVSGTYIWQFCDNRVSEEIMRQRPGTRNNKGVVDGYRRPKMAYKIVREMYRDHPAKS